MNGPTDPYRQHDDSGTWGTPYACDRAAAKARRDEEARLEAAVQKAGVDGGMATSDAIDNLVQFQQRQSEQAARLAIELNTRPRTMPPEWAIRVGRETFPHHDLQSSAMGLAERIAAACPAPSITVRPLVWTLIANGLSFVAYHERLRLYVASNRGQPCVLITPYLGAPLERTFPTLEAAQTAAQLEWATFIRAAIQP